MRNWFIVVLWAALNIIVLPYVFATCPTPPSGTRFETQNDAVSDVCTYNGTHSVRGFRTLTINGDFTVNGDFDIDGTLVVNGSLTVNGDLDVIGTIRVNGNLDVTGSMNIDFVGSMTITATGSLNVDQDVNNGGWWDFPDTNGGEMNVGGDFINEENGNLTISDGAILDVEGEIVLETNSQLNVEDGGVIIAGEGITNNGGDAALVVAGDDTDCSDGCCGSGCGSLPVEFTYITITPRNGEQHLVWETATEINNEGFVIEAKVLSTDVFEYLDFVVGHGTTSEVQKYAYALGANGYKYYRLKQIDYDGQYEYSPVVALQHNLEQAGYAVFPNPTTGAVRLEGSGQTAFQLYDAFGTALLSAYLLSHEVLEEKVSDCLSASPNGSYILTLQTAQGPESIRIIKN